MQSVIERGHGWKPERRAVRAAGRVRTLTLGATLAFGALLAPDETVPRFEPWVIDQGGYQACTGHNGAGAIYEKTGKKVSPWALWQWGLVHEGYDEDDLPNDGVRSSAMMKAFRRHGAPLYEKWNEETEGFDPFAVPPALADIGAQKFNTDAVPLYAKGQQLVDLLVDGMARGYSGGIVVKVDRGIDRAGSDPVGPEDGPSRGLHIMTLRRAMMLNRRRVIETVNSWGTNSGDDGLIRLSAERAGQAVYAWLLRGVS